MGLKVIFRKCWADIYVTRLCRVAAPSAQNGRPPLVNKRSLAFHLQSASLMSQKLPAASATVSSQPVVASVNDLTLKKTISAVPAALSLATSSKV